MMSTPLALLGQDGDLQRLYFQVSYSDIPLAA